ncbi:MAG TPA: twin-arginine translocase subunit TatC [Candidatus Saccharimonadales bacterium]|nr:twin-arginine translocase subunit TatC [Candidatus Saccharimonadales bacterium]
MGNAKFQAPAPTTNSTATQAQSDQSLPTFLDHVHELRRRLFWVVGIVLVASSVAYSFLGTILDVLTAPLGEQGLFYLTPGGGLSFSFKLCAYVGVLVAVPLIMYHLYRFMEPLMGNWRRSTIFYVGLSTILAVSGVLFAYFVSLPAAIKFLTGFNVNHVQAMLTADSYLSFVATYLLGAALLFQIPLLLLIINTMTPLKPSKLMKLQKFVIVGAFILAAMISPTPDIMNQAFLAIPIIAMYQLGILMVWAQNSMRRRKEEKLAARAGVDQQKVEDQEVQPVPAPILAQFAEHHMRPAAVQKPAVVPVMAQRPAQSALQPVVQQRMQPAQVRYTLRPQAARRVFTDIAPRRVQPGLRPAPVQAQPMPVRRPATIQSARTAPRLSVPARSIDGFSSYRPANAAGTS